MTLTTPRRTPGRLSAPSGRRTQPKGRPPKLGTGIFWVVGLLTSVAFVSPIAWAIIRSFDRTLALSTVGTATGEEVTVREGMFASYLGLLLDYSFHKYIWNSILIGLGTGIITTVLSAFAGYGLARFNFRGKTAMFAGILLVFMIPFQALLTPVFIELDMLGLSDSRLGLILLYATFNLPFGVFVMKNTFHAIPAEVEEAAAVDGATTLQTFRRVLLPLVIPGLATVMLYAFLWSWTEFVAAYALITSDDITPVPVALQNLALGQYGSVNFGFLIAGTVLAMLPCIVLYLSLQRYYVRGLLAGSVKS